MPFCGKCGAEYQDGAQFCGKCGNNLSAAPTQENPQPNTQNNTQKPNEKNVIDKMMDTKDETASMDAADISNNKVISLFSYLGILFLIPLLGAKNSKYAQFHAKQGITLFILQLAFDFVFNFISSTFSGAFYSLDLWNGYYGYSVIGWIIRVVFYLIPVALTVLGIVNAVSGKAKRLPVIGDFEVRKVD